ncbi:type IIL restriction-modification enzyme MmeI [Qipengyuania vulgaris]|uniref:type IIL restriction-modification enzyme MmeI n=1 Tax=Qipengyuania vulgaris TaxID=291985 RepID=UPI001927B5A8|nr:type IIL restriction-modification enzyme MmeI [Qipengyuania vulgaris]
MICSPGVKLHGSGFIVTPEQAERLDPSSIDIARGDNEVKPSIRSGIGNEPQVIFEYRNGKDLMARPRGVMVIDTYGLSEAELRERHPSVWQHIHDEVKPHRDTNNRASYRENWWLFGEQRPEIRKALRGCERYIVTPITAKHRTFQFQAIATLPDDALIVIASADAYHLGVVASAIHTTWASRLGGTLEDRSRYNNSRCFDPFPFPADVPEPLANTVRTEAEALDALRKRVLAEHDDLTLTKLYNVLEALRSDRALTDAERDIHDRGLVTLIRRHHDAIDAAVAEAYGWPIDLPEEEILTRLVALNRERAAEESRGLIRYLRPEFQDPGYQPPVNERLDLGEPAAPLPDNIIAWPKDLQP